MGWQARALGEVNRLGDGIAGKGPWGSGKLSA